MNLRDQSRLPPASVDAFLIRPSGGNTGDSLIFDACERYMRDRGIDVWRSDGSLEDAARASDTEYLGAALAPFRGMLMFPGGLAMTVWLLVKGVDLPKWNAKLNAARTS